MAGRPKIDQKPYTMWQVFEAIRKRTIYQKLVHSNPLDIDIRVAVLDLAKIVDAKHFAKSNFAKYWIVHNMNGGLTGLELRNIISSNSTSSVYWFTADFLRCLRIKSKEEVDDHLIKELGARDG